MCHFVIYSLTLALHGLTNDAMIGERENNQLALRQTFD
jgi:hypothetical protein